MASQYLARLGIVLGVDSGELVTGIEKAKSQFKQFSSQVEKDTKAALREVSSLKDATEDYGRTLTKVEQIEREISKGRFMYAAQNVKDMLRSEAKAYDEKAASMKKINGVMSEQQKLAVTYQLTDFFTQIASGQNAMIAFIQQGGQLKDQMGGIGAALSAVASVFTPFKIAVGGAITYMAGLAYAMYQAQVDVDNFNKSLALTGNYAGLTIEKFRDLSREMAQASNTSIKDAKDALSGLVDSGKFTSQSIDAAHRAVLTYARVAGVSGADASKTLAGALSGSASEAKNLNDKMNFLTLEQYKNIEALSAAGKKQEAAREVAIALTTKLEQQSVSVGSLQQKWKDLTKTVSDWWETTKEALAGPTIEQNIDALGKQIEGLEQRMSKDTWLNRMFGAGNEKNLAAMKQQRENLLEIIRLRNRSAAEGDVGDAKSEIDDRSAAGGIAKEKQLALQIAKARAEATYQRSLASANEIKKLELDAQKEISEKKAEYANRSEEEKRAFAKELEEALAADILAINAKTQEKIRQIRVKNMVAQYQEEQRVLEESEAAKLQEYQKTNEARRTLGLKYYEEERNLLLESKRINMEKDLVGASSKELQIARSRFDLEKEIRDIRERTDIDATDKETYEARAKRNQELREQNYELAESLKYVQNTYDAVWNNMSTAIENFVRTGKFSIKDFTRSVIQDMLIMNMKLQAMTLIRGLLSSFGGWMSMKSGGGWGTGNAYGNQDLGGFFAGGGDPPVGKASVVGENGPELFIPRSAGTIIPNNQLGNFGSTTNVTNNYINAIDAKSFEQRLLESSNTIWAANQYANKSIASNGRRA